ncbi:MAG: MFS transporter [Candidatus Peribacteraceae bacterium]|nr:MFS transporter [Candidatus Peribacteraceae bacterium]
MDVRRKHLLRANIWKLYALEALQGAIFLIPVLIPFYRENNLSLTQIYLIEAIFALEIVLLEVPTGYLSDRWGRRNTLIAATIFWCAGWFWYGAGFSFAHFLLGELLMGIGSSLSSGTTEAIAYDSLAELSETQHYRHVAGLRSFFMMLAEACASILGGIIAFWSLRFSAWLTFGTTICGVLMAISLVEPHRHKLQGTEHMKEIWKICTHTLFHNVPLRSIIALHAVISTMTLSLFWLTQPYQIAIGLPLAFFGVMHASIVTIGALTARKTHAIAKTIDDRSFLVFIALTVVGCYFALGAVSALWGMAFFFLGRIAWAFLSPLTSDMVNRMTNSDVRATVLSIRSLSGRVLFAAAIPFLGKIADQTGNLSLAFLLVAIVGGTLLLFLFLLIQPVWRNIPS